MDQLKIDLQPPKLPQELIDCCAVFIAQSNAWPLQKFSEEIGKMSSLHTNVESSLSEFQRLLQEEQEKEEICLGQEKRSPSIDLKKMSLAAVKCRNLLAKAANCNMIVHEAITSHLDNLRTLSLPFSEIEAKLPSIKVLESGEDQAAIKEFQRLIDRVEEMCKQRQMLYSQLREALRADDITKLAARQTDLAAHFFEQLAKHKQLISLIEGNLAEQEKIIVALTEANARHAETRRSIADIQQRRASAVAALLTSAKAFPNLIRNCEESLNLYPKIKTMLAELFRHLRDFWEQQEHPLL